MLTKRASASSTSTPCLSLSICTSFGPGHDTILVEHVGFKAQQLEEVQFRRRELHLIAWLSFRILRSMVGLF